MLQCVAVCCSVLHCVAVCCSVISASLGHGTMILCCSACRSVLQCVAVCCSVVSVSPQHSTMIVCVCVCVCIFVHMHGTHGNTLHCTATHCNSTALHCNTLQQHSCFNTSKGPFFSYTSVVSSSVCLYVYVCANTLQHSVHQCNTLHYTATHGQTLPTNGNPLQQAATH